PDELEQQTATLLPLVRHPKPGGQRAVFGALWLVGISLGNCAHTDYGEPEHHGDLWRAQADVSLGQPGEIYQTQPGGAAHSEGSTAPSATVAVRAVFSRSVAGGRKRLILR